MADKAQTYNGYCVKCKEKRDFEGTVEVSKTGMNMAKGKCPGLWHNRQPDPGQGQGLTRGSFAGGGGRWDRPHPRFVSRDRHEAVMSG